MTENKLAVIDGETLMDMRLPPQRFCIHTLLPQGLSILSGASKIGKSWMALDMCLHVAKGEPMWNQPTTSGTVLYLCFSGNNSVFADALNAYAGLDVKAKGLKQMMNTWRYILEEHGVYFRSYRSNGQRLLDISFSAVESDVSDSNDGNISGGEISVICDPCVPAIGG